MSENMRSFLIRAWGCLTSPRSALESIKEEDLRRGVVLIIIMAAISAWAGYIYASKLPFELPEGGRYTPFGQAISPAALRRNLMNFYALSDGLRAIVAWLVPSALIHLFASLRGRGGLSRMLALRGFASIPLILQHFLRLIDAYIISDEAIINISAAQAYDPSLATRLMREASSVFTLFGIWTFALTFMAATINYKASTVKAATATASAYLAFILLCLVLPI